MIVAIYLLHKNSLSVLENLESIDKKHTYILPTLLFNGFCYSVKLLPQRHRKLAIY